MTSIGFQTPEEKIVAGILNTTAKDLQDMKDSKQLLNSFVESEREYVRLVMRPVLQFMNMLKVRKLVNAKVMGQMFLNFEGLAELHEQLLKDVEQAVSENRFATDFGNILAETAPFFKIYGLFSEQQEEALKVYEKTFKSSSKFRKLVKEVYIATGVRPGDLIGHPTARLPQYFVYLEAYGMKLAPQTEEKINTDFGMMKVKDALDAIRARLRDKFSREAVVGIQMKVCNNSVALVDPARLLLKKGQLIMDDNKAYAALFNDMLLILNAYGKPCQILRLKSIEVDCEGVTGFKVFNTIKKEILIFESTTEASAKSWVTEIQWAIKEDNDLQIGRQISDNYFEKMILKKAKQVPLIDPNTPARTKVNTGSERERSQASDASGDSSVDTTVHSSSQKSGSKSKIQEVYVEQHGSSHQKSKEQAHSPPQLQKTGSKTKLVTSESSTSTAASTSSSSSSSSTTSGKVVSEKPVPKKAAPALRMAHEPVFLASMPHYPTEDVPPEPEESPDEIPQEEEQYEDAETKEFYDDLYAGMDETSSNASSEEQHLGTAGDPNGQKKKKMAPPIRGPKPELRQTLVALMNATRQAATASEAMERNRLEAMVPEDAEFVPDNEIEEMMQSKVYTSRKVLQ
eukprot:TRINITY_DN11817_c0_g1_i1.p1 TRINITY_DN11817_c0_g1~~TRINITY_DN11817_c0_g1_i1.p1  ORF type:complete len:628 (-),score=151.55 TRINITY_DN11817_c0_g1_i1:64-1947(-)